MSLRVGTPTEPLRLAVLISGGGSGMEALLNHIEESETSCHITVLVLSDRLGAKGLSIAENHGIENIAIPLPKSSSDPKIKRLKHEKLIQDQLILHNIEAIILSGYMRLLTPNFVSNWEGRILNIHPSLLPKHPGAHAHQDVLASGDKQSGCTVHFVDSGMDTGAIISQSEVPVFPNDTLETLQERIKVIEHQIYPLVIDDFAEGKIRLVDGRIVRR
jgi:formyltetrahydrofolate-dependent phosphoribosylglycinamide formyltransferase